jgi:hypothetical protein
MSNWDFLEKYNIDVWCICLKERDDRYTYATNEFKRIGLIDKVNWHRPERNKLGSLGCLLSHKFCAESAYCNNKHALVFEDDVVFTNDWLKKIKYIKKFLYNEPKWNILRFGSIISSFHKKSKSSNYIWSCKSFANHALIYNKNIIKQIFCLDNFTDNYHIDDYCHDNNNLLDFTLVDNMCYQRSGLGSDNVWWNENIIQGFMLHPLVFEKLQKYNNIQMYWLSLLPICLQEYLTIWGVLTKLGFLTLKIKNIFRYKY